MFIVIVKALIMSDSTETRIQAKLNDNLVHLKYVLALLSINFDSFTQNIISWIQTINEHLRKLRKSNQMQSTDYLFKHQLM